jgi:hypothetical protein
MASEIRAPHFDRIYHAPRTYADRYSLFESKTQAIDYRPTWSQYRTVHNANEPIAFKARARSSDQRFKTSINADIWIVANVTKVSETA